MEDNRPVMLELTVGEVNKILGVLVALPYGEVADLIAKVKTQGDAAIEEDPAEPAE